MPGEIIVSDLYGTIMTPWGTPDDLVTPRPMTGPVFRDYRNDGHRIVLASSADFLHASKRLAQFGLAGSVDNITRVKKSEALSGNVFMPKAKMYGDYLRDQLGLSPEAISKRVFFTGDEPEDCPADVNRAVCLLDPRGYLHPATLHREVFNRVHQNGNGHMYEGFCRMRTDSGGRVLLDEFSVELSLAVWNIHNPAAGEMEIPVISVHPYSD